MSKFKHDLLLRLIKLVDLRFAGIYTILIEPLHRSIRKVI